MIDNTVMNGVNKYIKPELIEPDLKAQTKQEAIAMLVDTIFRMQPSVVTDLTSEYVYQEVIKRETVHTTGLGGRLAFPHARIEQCTDLVVAIGISKQGVDFDSIDNSLCHIICLMISPTQRPYIILQTVAALARFFGQKENIDKVLAGLSPQQIADSINSSVRTSGKSVMAQEVMRPVAKSVTLDTTIERTAQIMHFGQIDVLPVVDDNKLFYGEISCLKIFSYGVPDFFNQLQTVSFVKYLDPFEKYFKFRKDLKVRDLYDSDVIAISMDTTLMEIIFEMTAKNRSRLFVIDKGKLVGEVDRFSIIDKILFF
jgi:mannitol/fructose-specific phosphotransferase system IIA component (Ntr-type)/CBS domain-containing protein